jgi:phosphatidylglycerophosphate synthase
MSEYDLFFVWSETTGHLWSMIQFWVSVSFGLIVVAHMAPDKLNNVLVSIILLLYTCISIFIGALIVADGNILQAVYADAAKLVDTGGASSATIAALSNYQGNEQFGGFFVMMALPLTFISTIGYFIYSYRRSS